MTEQEIIEQYIHDYLKKNLRVNISCSRHSHRIEVVLDKEVISTTDDYHRYYE